MKEVTNNANKCGQSQGSKGIDLEELVRAIRMKDSELLDDFAMTLTTIIIGICSLDNKVEEISIVKKFLQVVPQGSCKSLPPSSNLATLRTYHMRSLVILRPMRRDFVLITVKRKRNTSYSHTMSGLHEKKKERKM